MEGFQAIISRDEVWQEFLRVQLLVGVLTILALLLWTKIRAHEKLLRRYGSQTILMESIGRNTEEQAMEKLARLGFKPSFYQKFERRFWIESGLHLFFYPIPSMMLPVFCGLFGVLFSWGTYRVFLVKGIAISGFWLGVLTPLQIVELYKYHQNRLIINELPIFFGILTRWAQINPDVFFCMSKLEKCGLRLKLVGPFTKLITACENGVPTSLAFKQLESSFHLKLMAHFSKCLQEVIQNRGDLEKLLEAFEEESYQIQLEEGKRNAVHMKYKLLINSLCIASFILIYFLLKANQVLSSFYIDTDLGQVLLSSLALLVVGTFMFSLNASRARA